MLRVYENDVHTHFFTLTFFENRLIETVGKRLPNLLALLDGPSSLFLFFAPTRYRERTPFHPLGLGESGSPISGKDRILMSKPTLAYSISLGPFSLCATLPRDSKTSDEQGEALTSFLRPKGFLPSPGGFSLEACGLLFLNSVAFERRSKLAAPRPVSYVGGFYFDLGLPPLFALLPK